MAIRTTFLEIIIPVTQFIIHIKLIKGQELTFERIQIIATGSWLTFLVETINSIFDDVTVCYGISLNSHYR